jgi:hypothetical protein
MHDAVVAVRQVLHQRVDRDDADAHVVDAVLVGTLQS